MRFLIVIGASRGRKCNERLLTPLKKYTPKRQQRFLMIQTEGTLKMTPNFSIFSCFIELRSFADHYPIAKQKSGNG